MSAGFRDTHGEEKPRVCARKGTNGIKKIDCFQMNIPGAEDRKRLRARGCVKSVPQFLNLNRNLNLPFLATELPEIKITITIKSKIRNKIWEGARVGKGSRRNSPSKLTDHAPRGLLYQFPRTAHMGFLGVCLAHTEPQSESAIEHSVGQVQLSAGVEPVK
jgi:hypothetical protein